ncbi:hypothetical protein KX816_18255 [Sphingosinicellaceae bacterium]|nr:hypothetical protein KX816_18255 [Sphingosinicellaceae bacterium]
MSLAALLARRLCHDFAGPAGAIGTAVDMLGDAPDPELLELAADSSAALTAALELYRYVLTPSAEPLAAARAKALVSAWLASRGEVTLDWSDEDAPWPPGFAALTAGLAMVAAEAAPRGTVLVIEVGNVVATGTTLPGEVVAALGGELVTTTRASLAGVLAEQARDAGVVLDTGNADGTARLTASYQSSRLPR